MVTSVYAGFIYTSSYTGRDCVWQQDRKAATPRAYWEALAVLRVAGWRDRFVNRELTPIHRLSEREIANADA